MNIKIIEKSYLIQLNSKNSLALINTDFYFDKNKVHIVSDYLEEVKYPINEKKIISSVHKLKVLLKEIIEKDHSIRSIVLENTEKLFDILNNYYEKVAHKIELEASHIRSFHTTNLELFNSKGINHGDLHLKNILINKDKLMFIDFESVFHLGINDILDWINLSRFINIKIINEYFRNNSISVISNDTYKAYFNWLMIKNLCVLMHLEDENKWLIDDEFKKFTRQFIK